MDTLEVARSSHHKQDITWDKSALRKDPLPGPKDNLICRTLAQIESKIPCMQIDLKKKIPIGAGLGGGSSDAGALLRFFVAEGLITSELAEELARSIGADVPFFLRPQPAWVSGTGEKRLYTELSPDLKEVRFLIVIPPFSVSTAVVFERLRKASPSFKQRRSFCFPNLTNWESLKKFLKSAKNDLEETVRQLHPEISPILEALRSSNAAYSGLSGSGSSCIAVFESSSSLIEFVKDLNPIFRKYSCRTTEARTYSESVSFC